MKKGVLLKTSDLSWVKNVVQPLKAVDTIGNSQRLAFTVYLNICIKYQTCQSVIEVAR